MTSLTTEPVPQTRRTSLVVRKTRIRPLTEGDLAEIAELWRRAGRSIVPAPAAMKRIFFEWPWHDGSLPSLVCENAKGGVMAYLAVMARPMMFRERSVRAAVAHHLVAEPSREGVRAGINLVRRFLHGPQDLSLATGNDFERRIWTSLGGSVSPLQSFSWIRPLRPARYALGSLKDHGLPASVAATLHPACQAVDATLNLFASRTFPLCTPTALSDDLDAVTMLACLSAFADDRALKPVYDVASLTSIFAALRERHDGTLHKVAVRTQSGRVLGWYLYILGASGTAEVLQVGGKREAVGDVLDHLFYHARQRGAVAVSGPMDARLLGVLSSNHCIFHGPGNSWTLVHSRDSRIAQAIHGGDVFLSRLENLRWLETEEWSNS